MQALTLKRDDTELPAEALHQTFQVLDLVSSLAPAALLAAMPVPTAGQGSDWHHQLAFTPW